MEVALSELRAHLEEYILQSHQKNTSSSYLRLFRDTKFSCHQSVLVQDFLKLLYQVTTTPGWKDIAALTHHLYEAIIQTREALKQIYLETNRGSEKFSDGGYINTASWHFTTQGLVDALNKGQSGTYIYRIFSMLAFKTHILVFDIGIFSSKPTVTFIRRESQRDPNPYITNRML